jgi:hypothetical protein
MSSALSELLLGPLPPQLKFQFLRKSTPSGLSVWCCCSPLADDARAPPARLEALVVWVGSKGGRGLYFSEFYGCNKVVFWFYLGYTLGGSSTRALFKWLAI